MADTPVREYSIDIGVRSWNDLAVDFSNDVRGCRNIGGHFVNRHAFLKEPGHTGVFQYVPIDLPRSCFREDGVLQSVKRLTTIHTSPVVVDKILKAGNAVALIQPVPFAEQSQQSVWKPYGFSSLVVYHKFLVGPPVKDAMLKVNPRPSGFFVKACPRNPVRTGPGHQSKYNKSRNMLGDAMSGDAIESVLPST
ncbi:hypothetical protein [Rhizobium laguerreae]|uniref:hypothetical protein n=1 Tax=Rhizobium laguerreae TaxID=1076926 RepID=UPI001C91B9E0|nr:hypothetical protein [Rhizobium laguerreae]MBY3320645.1 hypothetical protein [Rhizobium laguerreae]